MNNRQSLMLVMLVILVMLVAVGCREQESKSSTGAQSAQQSVSTELPAEVSHAFEAIEKAQGKYVVRDWDGDGILEYARSLADLEKRGLLDKEIAAAESTFRPTKQPYRGYMFGVATKVLQVNSVGNRGWLSQTYAENLKKAKSLEVDGKLTRGFAVYARHADMTRDPVTHCLVGGELIKGSTASHHLSCVVDWEKMDVVFYWYSWSVAE